MGHVMYSAAETLGANRVITVGEARGGMYFMLDPGGAARNVTLPAETSCAQQWVRIVNTGDGQAELLTVLASDATTVVGRVPIGDTGEFMCDGTTWRRLADRKAPTVATAETLTGNRTLTVAEAHSCAVWRFDPAAARDLTMPDETVCGGLTLTVVNAADAAEDITVKSSAAATIGTISQNEWAIITCDGVAWAVGIQLTT